MPALLTVKIKNQDAPGEYLIINQADFNEEEHQIFDEEEGPQMAAEDSAGPAKIGPATLVGDNEVVLPRVPHPEGLIPPAEDFKPVPPKAKVGEVIGYDAGHEVRAAGESENMIGALDATFGAVPKEEAFKVSIPEQEPGAFSVTGVPVGSPSERQKASEEAAEQKQQASEESKQEPKIDPDTASRQEMLDFVDEKGIEVGDNIRTDYLREKVRNALAEKSA